MVVSGDIIHDAAVGAVTVSNAPFTSVGLDLAFVILAEGGEDKTAKSFAALTEDE